MVLPNIPDNLYKVLFVIGLGLLIYAFTEQAKIKNFDNELGTEIFALRDSLDINEAIIKRKREKLIDDADLLSRKFQVENPLSEVDSSIEINYTIRGSNLVVRIHDSIANLFQQYQDEKFRQSLFNIRWDSRAELLKSKFKHLEQDQTWLNYFYLFGVILTFIGLLGFLRINALQEKILYMQLYEKPKVYMYCQSCGRKFDTIVSHGTEKNGDKNPAFCGDCYKVGKFSEVNLTLTELIRRTISNFSNRNYIFKRRIIKRLKNLDRWKKDRF